MAAVVGSATIRILPDSSGFSAALNSQLNGLTQSLGAMGGRNITGNLNRQLKTLGDSLQRTGNRSVLVGEAFTYGLTRPLIAAGKAIIGVAADFDQAVTTFAAITIPPPTMSADGLLEEESLEGFRQRVTETKALARELAEASTFSAVEISESMADLGRAGLTTDEQLKALIPTLANVALVEGTDMKAVTDDLIQVFTGFGGSLVSTKEDLDALAAAGTPVMSIFGGLRSDAEDMGAEFEHMSDILSLTSQRTTTNITDLATAFTYAGPMAAKAGVSFEQTSAALGVLAQSGFDASMGGTALRGIITRLAVPTQISEGIFDKFFLDPSNAQANAEEVAAALDGVKLSEKELQEIQANSTVTLEQAGEAWKKHKLILFDTEGKMRPLAEIVDRFAEGNLKVGDAMKLFGQRAGPAFLALVANQPLLESLTNELENAEGALGKMAERMKESASTQFKLLKNAFVDIAIALGESGVLGSLTHAAQGLRTFVYEISEGNVEALKFGVMAAGLVAAIGPLGIIIGLLQKGFGQFFHFLAILTTPLGAVTVGIGALAVGIGILASRSEPLREALADLYDTAVLIVGPIVEIGKALGAAFKGDAVAGLEATSSGITNFFKEINTEINKWIAGGGLRDVVMQIISMINVMGDAWEAIKPAISSAVTEIGETGRAAFDLLMVVIPEVTKGLSDLAYTILPVLEVAFGLAWSAAAAGLNALEGLFKFLKPVADIISDVLGPGLLLLGQAFLIARINGFRFLDVFRAFRSEGLAAAQVAVQLNSRMGALSKTFGAMFSSLGGGGGIGGAVGSLTTSLVRGLGGLTGIVGRALAPLGRIVGGVFSRIGNSISSAGIERTIGRIALRSMEAFAAPFLGFAGLAHKAITQGIPAIKAAWQNLSFGFRAIVGTMVASLGDGVSRMISMVRTGVPGMLSTIRNAFTSIDVGGMVSRWGAAFSNLGPAIMGIAAAFRNMATGVDSQGYTLTERIRLRFGIMWEEIKSGAQGASNVLKSALAGISTGLNVAAQGAMAFSSGMMLAEATDLKGKLSALIPILTSIGIAASVATGTIGALTLALTAIAALAGTVFGKMKDEMKDLTDATEGFSAAFAIEEEGARTRAILEEVNTAFNNIGADGQSGMASITLQLQDVGLTVGGMIDAMERGGESVNDFISVWETGWVNAEIDKNFDRAAMSAGELEYQTGRLQSQFSKRTEVRAFRDLFDDFKAGRLDAQAFDAALDELGISEEVAEEKTVSLSDQIKDLGTKMTETLDAALTLAQGLDPSKDLQKNMDTMVTSIRSFTGGTGQFLSEGESLGNQLAEGLFNGSKDAMAVYARQNADGLGADFAAVVAAAAAAPGATEESIQATFRGARQAMVDMFREGGLELNPATALADAIIAQSGAGEVDYFTEFAPLAAEGAKILEGANAALVSGAEGVEPVEFKVPYAVVPEKEPTLPPGFGGPIVGALFGDKPLPIPDVPVPQVEAVVEVRPGESMPLPPNGVPAQVLIKVRFSDIENMDVVLTAITAFVSTVANALLAVAGGIETVSMRMGDMIRNVVTLFGVLGSSATMASFVVVGAVSRMVLALSQIPLVMTEVSRSLLTGFSRPFSIIANAVWNPFASFINIASRSLGMGSLLPTGMSIPVFHKGGVVGDATGDSYDGSRSLKSDEMMALLQRGEGVMSEQMMANMTDSQLRAFRAGEKRWWAVGGPYESGSARAAGRVDAGADPMSMGGNFGQIRAMYESTIKPLVNSIGGIGGSSVERVGDGSMDYMRGFNDTIESKKAAYLSSVGLPPGFNLSGAVPSGFDIGGWRAFLGANYGKPGNYPLLISYLQAAGIPHLVNSTVRPGSMTVSGNLSRHALGRAVDFGAPGDANYDSAGLLRINRAFAPMLGVLGELIYSGPGGITDKAYGAAVMAGHHNHVHVALARGGIIDELTYAMLGEGGKREVVLPMSDPVRALSLAKRSGLLKMLSEAQSAAPSSMAPSSRSSSSASFDGGPLGGGPGNTYNINGVGLDQVKREIAARDEASLRRRR